MKLLTALFACVALILAPSARAADFGIVPGSAVGAAVTIPFKCGFGGPPENDCRVDVDAIRLATSVSQAGARPDATGGGELLKGTGFFTRDFFVDGPPGFIGNPTVVPACDRLTFRNTWSQEHKEAEGCPPVSQVGVATVQTTAGSGEGFTNPVYLLTPSPGYPASFGFQFGNVNVPIVVNANLRTDGDYGLVLGTTEISVQGGQLVRAFATIWGVPADPIHNPERWDPSKEVTFINNEKNEQTVIGGWGAPSGAQPIPLVQTPADCKNDSLLTTVRMDSWQEPGNFLPNASTPNPSDYIVPAPQPTGCAALGFDPTIALVPSAADSDSPTGVSVQMEIPQNQDPKGLATPELKKAVVTLPEGMSVNPAAADGIEGCTTAQIGLLTTHGAYPNPIRFAKGDPSCPQAARVGALTVDTPLLEEQLEGDVYLATPYDNPFHSLLAIYLVIRGPGFTVKVPGRVEPDPNTGQLKTTFDYSPQLPFENLKLNFFGGPRAPLATSPLCGTQTILTELEPWSHTPGPKEAAGTPNAFPVRSYEANKGPTTGGPCSSTLASRPFDPQLTAGTANPIAGAYAGMTMRLTRPDGNQPLAGLTVRPPAGFTAKLAGVPYCSQARIAAAEARSGKSEAAFPSCPAASLVGHTLVGAGAGPTPLFTEGKAYLAGPYKGAPISLVVITPALAGGTPGNPVFDLGNVVVRVALHVDPETTQVTAVSDPVPQSLMGIPLRIRDIRFALDREGFGLNPTDCSEKSFDVDASGQSGATATLSDRFQVAECGALGFKPGISLRLKGGTKRGGHPQFTAVVTPRKGDANISSAAVTLPHSAFLDQAHIRTICTRVQYAAGGGGGEQCPAASIYGTARAYTPLLDRPVEGPVYLRSSNHNLPDLVVALHGQVNAELDGRIDSKNGGIRNSFEMAPDVPVSKFVLEMQGGRKGLIVNSTDLCKGAHRARANLAAHNGRRYGFKPEVVAAGCKSRAHAARRSHRAQRRQR